MISICHICGSQWNKQTKKKCPACYPTRDETDFKSETEQHINETILGMKRSGNKIFKPNRGWSIKK